MVFTYRVVVGDIEVEGGSGLCTESYYRPRQRHFCCPSSVSMAPVLRADVVRAFTVGHTEHVGLTDPS
jgi:hypothetical protein